MDVDFAVLHIAVGLLFVGHGAQTLFGALSGHGLSEFAGGALLALVLLVYAVIAFSLAAVGAG